MSQAEVQIHGAPQAWLFKDTVAGQLSLRICGDCGHAELQVSNFAELYEKCAAAEGTAKPGDPLPPGDEACLSCGARFPHNATHCPACGWTWTAGERA